MPTAARNKDREALPIKHVYPIRDTAPPDHPEPTTGGWAEGLPIAIDLGTSHTRVGYATNIESGPQHHFYTQVSKFRDRKVNHTYQLVGNDTYLDSTSKQNIRTPFDGAVIQNWDMIETILDYSFAKIDVQSQGGVQNPIIMSEMLGCPVTQRRTMTELLFESYNAPSVAYGIDSLFSFKYNRRNDSSSTTNDNYSGLVISAGNESTDVIPVVNGHGVMALAKRINWGGRQAASYLQNLLTLKYPTFPTKLTFNQANNLMHDHCYVSNNYEEEVSTYLNWDGIQDRERVVEAPYTPNVVVEKSEEELARIAEKRKESGRRLQEQAAKARLEKLIEKENNLLYYQELQERVANGPKRDIKKTLDREGFRDEAQLQKTIDELNKSIRRARKLDVGDDGAADDSAAEPPSFPLLDIADEDLNDEEIKEKKKQKMLKASYEARQRAKEEKLLEKKRQEEEAQKAAEWRENDLEGWIQHHRELLAEIYNRRHEKQQLKEDLANRKSHASQMRMKNIAALASDSNRGKRKRAGGASRGGAIDDDPDDTFGADDNDWSIYRNIANATDSEEEEEEERQVQELQEQLTKHDQDFRIEDFTRLPGAIDWRDSVVNMFLRGPREYDAESQAQAHQMNLNIERIRVPEVLFQPSNAGVDQAGISELCEEMLVRQWPEKPPSDEATQNIFLTGGLSQFENFDTRVYNEIRSVLNVGKPLRVVRARDPHNDAWRGMAEWSTTEEFKHASISRKDYDEMGVEYMKEHRYGNSVV